MSHCLICDWARKAINKSVVACSYLTAHGEDLGHPALRERSFYQGWADMGCPPYSEHRTGVLDNYVILVQPFEGCPFYRAACDQRAYNALARLQDLRKE